jgi:hypothetical protein
VLDNIKETLDGTSFVTDSGRPDSATVDAFIDAFEKIIKGKQEDDDNELVSIIYTELSR